MSPKLRVIHVVGGLDRGGIEVWLTHVVRHTDKSRFDIHIVNISHRRGILEEALRIAGAEVHHCPRRKNPLLFGRDFSQLLKKHGPFDIVHSHVDHLSGYISLVAALGNVPVRVAHSHNDRRDEVANASGFRAIYFSFMKRVINRFANVGLAVSDKAGWSLFGKRWNVGKNLRVLYCGVDLEALENTHAVTPPEPRIASASFVVGHVGRLSPQKNHEFILTVAEKTLAVDPHALFMCVGDGPLRNHLETEVQRRGIAERVIFTGPLPNALGLLAGSVDVFLMPSLHEGLPIVLLETQALGCPAVVADTVSQEVEVVPGAITWLSLDAPIDDWVQALLRSVENGPLPRAQSLGLMRNSPFDVRKSVAALEEAYDEAMRKDR